MSKLPPGWERVAIVDLLAPLADGRIIHQGWSPQCAQGSSPNSDVWGVLKTTSIQNGRFLPEHNKLLPDALEPRILLEVNEGDILLTCAGPRIRCGVPCLVRSTRPKLIISGKMYRMRAMAPDIESRFVEAMLRAPVTQDAIDEIKTGMSESGMNLTHARFAKLEIPVPPTNEQKRIADKLDAVLARVDACRDRLDRMPAILKRFRQSVLAAATSGKLTEDWRTERVAGMQAQEESRNVARDSAQLHYAVTTTPDSAALHPGYEAGAIPDTWFKKPLAELCERRRVITYGVIKLGDEIADGVPCLRTSNVRWLRVDTEGMKRIAPSLSAEYGRTVLRGGEVLVNVRGTLGGVAAVVPEMMGWNVSREVAVVPSDSAVVASTYLALWIAADSTQRWLSRVEKGVAYTGINIEDLRNLPVNVPPLAEQTEIVRRVESLFAYADRIDARYATACAHVDKLTPATLAKAFRGELVPQDPNDEPASVLLQRISRKRKNGVATPSRKAFKSESHPQQAVVE